MTLIDKRFKQEIEDSETLGNYEKAKAVVKGNWEMDILISKELVGHDPKALNKPIYMWVLVIYKGAMLVKKDAKNTAPEIVETLVSFAENYEVEE